MSNQDNPTAADQGRGDSIENFEQFLLYSKAAIVQKLKQLNKSKNMITAHFGQGQYSLLTAVVDVLPDKDLLVLDYGSDEDLNQKLMQAERAVFKTSHEGITAQFTCSNFQRAKRHGKVAIACSLPDALVWVQRREYYRVKVPMSEIVTCELPWQEDEVIKFPSLDLSLGGLALHHTDQAIEFEEGQIYEACRLEIPNMGEGLANLEIRNIIPIGTVDSGGYRVGCQFQNLNMDLNNMIQRYIHNVETLISRAKSE